jgi:hypothetical protein
MSVESDSIYLFVSIIHGRYYSYSFVIMQICFLNIDSNDIYKKKTWDNYAWNDPRWNQFYSCHWTCRIRIRMIHGLLNSETGNAFDLGYHISYKIRNNNKILSGENTSYIIKCTCICSSMLNTAIDNHTTSI